MLDYQCVTRMAVASSRLPGFVPFRCRIVGKRCKNRPDFTPFVQICENGVKNDVFLHRFPSVMVLIQNHQIFTRIPRENILPKPQ